MAANNIEQIVATIESWSESRREAALRQVLQRYDKTSLWHDQADVRALAAVDGDVATLIDYGMLVHISTVVSHRRAIRHVYDLLLFADPSLSELEPAIDRHDLTKFSADEAYGYTQKWVLNMEGDAWNKALRCHYNRNSHHPEFYGRECNMSKADLLESIIDMIACRLERCFATPEVRLGQLFDIPDNYLHRYTLHDRALVKHYLDEWRASLVDSYWQDEVGLFANWEAATHREVFI